MPILLACCVLLLDPSYSFQSLCACVCVKEEAGASWSFKHTSLLYTVTSSRLNTLLSSSSKDVSLFTVYPADEIRRYWFRNTKKNAAKIWLTYKSQGKSREKQPYIFTPLRRLEALLKRKILVLINGRENNISPQPFHQPVLLQRDKPIV